MAYLHPPLIPPHYSKPASRDHARIAEEILSTILPNTLEDLAVRLWNDRLALGRSDAPCTLLLRHPAPLRELILFRSLFRLVDAYLAGFIEVEGDFERLFQLQKPLESLSLPWRDKARLLRLALSLPGYPKDQAPQRWCRTGERDENCRETIAHHYDVSNGFYRLWLDPEMVYSCAYFASEEQNLAAAQRDKLEYICRKLRLEPGHRLLDIGCGWGGLAIWAARHHGVEVRGITLSEQQHEWASRRVKEEGLEGKVRIELKDYRDLDAEGAYDRVVSVGMFEHIGIANFPRYFDTVKRSLKPGGLFLNHGITSANGWRKSAGTRFINTYIFPDGELARISDVIDAMEKAGFEILDTENLRRHYAMTLRHWVRNLEAHREEAVAESGETTYRLWRLYMAGCAFNFEDGDIAIHQVLAGHRNRRQPVPLRRGDLYR